MNTSKDSHHIADKWDKYISGQSQSVYREKIIRINANLDRLTLTERFEAWELFIQSTPFKFHQIDRIDFLIDRVLEGGTNEDH